MFAATQRNATQTPELAMIDLYAMGSPSVVKIYIAFEEMGLPYTVHPVDVFGEAQFKPEFLRLDPLAKVPVIVDHDGPGGKPYKLFESGAILLCLARKPRPGLLD
jgi:GST-like protein